MRQSISLPWPRPLVRFGGLVVAERWIREVDINLLLVTPTGVVALDARMVLADAGTRKSDLPRSAIRPYPSEYITNVSLREGTPVTIRPIRPDDEPLMVLFHHTLSEESVRQRYMHAAKLDERTTHERLVRVCFADFDGELALVVERQLDSGAREILAVGRLSRDRAVGGDRGSEAEFALLVGDHWQGKGIGRKLLTRLTEVARQERIRRIYADILSQNLRMQRLCEQLGFIVGPAAGGEGVVSASFTVQ